MANCSASRSKRSGAFRVAVLLILALVASRPGMVAAGPAQAGTAQEFPCALSKVQLLALFQTAATLVILAVLLGQGSIVIAQEVFSVVAILLACEAGFPALKPSGITVAPRATPLPGIEAHQVGNEPVDAATGDFNRDGAVDLAVANRLSHNVSILLGRPDGTFQDPVSVPAGLNPVKVLVGDFTGDQVPDLLTQHGKDLALLVGNGNGTFQAPLSRAPVPDPGDFLQAAVVGDFNGDSRPDLVVSVFRVSGSSLETSLWLGNGDGTFQAPVVLGGLPENDVVHAVADLDGDPHPDLVTSTAVLRGAGGGAFHPVQVRPPGFFTFRLLVVDLNGDGRLDLVGLSVPERAVSVSLGNGDGSFQPPRHYSVTESFAIAVLDLNQDGYPDIVASETTSDHFSVLVGNGDGTFQGAPMLATSTAAVSPGAVSVAAGDFNADGVPDLAVGHTSTTATVLLRQAGGGISAPLDLGVRGRVATGELTGDGQVDVAIAGSAGGGNALTVRPGGGAGGLGPPVATALPAGDVVGLQAADVNGDSRLDAVVLFADKLAVLPGNGNGTFQAPLVTPGGPRLQGLTLADFNQDGRLDVALAEAGDFNLLNGRVAILLGQGDGTFQAAPALLPGTALVGVTAGDFTGDGRPDVVAVFEAPVFTWRIALLRGDGDGTFQAPVDVPAPGGLDFFPAPAMAATDFDGDGRLDLLVFPSDNQVAVLSGNGDGTFRPPVVFDAGGAAGLLVADLDGDGRPDLVVPNFESAVTLLINTTTPDPALALSVNRTAFGPGQTLTATATLTPGLTPGPVDAYFVVQVPPTAALFSILPGNVLVPGLVPFAAGFTPVPLTGPVVTYRFTGGEPGGVYRMYTGLAAAGSAPPAVIGVIDQDPFVVIP